MKKAIHAEAYIECSVRIKYNVKVVFETAIKLVLHAPSAAPGKVDHKAAARGAGCKVAQPSKIISIMGRSGNKPLFCLRDPTFRY
jgi:hypothetical protein